MSTRQQRQQVWLSYDLGFRGDYVRLHGVALTSSGRELSHIVHIEPTEEYTRDLIAFFKTKNLQMTEVKTPTVHQETEK